MSFRVAVVASSETLGGAETYLSRLYGGLIQRHAVRPTLIGTVPGWPEFGARIPVTAPRKLTRQVSLAKQARPNLLYARELLAAVDPYEFDLIHVQYVREKLLTTRLASRAPVLWTEHGPLPTRFPPGALHLLRRQAKSAHILAVSAAVRDSLSDQSIPAQVVWNPLPKQRPTDQRLGTPVSVLWAGRLHPAKRVDLLTAAAGQLPDVDFHVAGDGPAAETLRASAPDNVTFHGHLTDLSPLLSTVDVLVVTSGREAREGSPMIALEARVAGIPLLMAADCHAAEEAVSLGGSLFSPHAGDLARAIRAITPGAARVQIPALAAAERSHEKWIDATFDAMTRAAATNRGPRT